MSIPTTENKTNTNTNSRETKGFKLMFGDNAVGFLNIYNSLEELCEIEMAQKLIKSSKLELVEIGSTTTSGADIAAQL